MSLQEKIKKLRHSFIAKLPDYLTKIEVEFAKLSKQPTQESEQALQELFFLLHSIKGGASTFELMHLFEVAKVSEANVSVLLDDKENGFSTVDFASAYTTLELSIHELITAILQIKSEVPRAEKQVKPENKEPTLIIDNHDQKLIYICDDMPDTIEHLCTQLKYLGYTVKPFTDTERLSQAVEERFPDAIIMDVMFPTGVFSGPEIINQLRKKLKQLPPVVFISGRSDYSSRYAAIQAGGSAYFLKPLKIFDLVQTLDEITQEQVHSPHKILVVDDDPEVAKYHSAILNDAEMVTLELYNPEKILQTLSSFKPDLVLMDMHMPQCSGIDVAKMIRQIPEYISLPIIFLSGEMDQVKQANALRAGVEGFLTKPIHPISLISEVNVRVQRMHELRALMVRDSLTGLFNHTFMQTYLEKTYANSLRTQKPCCVVMLDLDKFKNVNDTYGHQMGDEVLITISRLLRQNIRASDAAGRYGGEEFILVLDQTTMEDAFKIVEKIRNAFSNLNFEQAEISFQCTFSAGISSSHEHQNITTLLESADQALYKSKQNGRNCVTLAERFEG